MRPSNSGGVSDRSSAWQWIVTPARRTVCTVGCLVAFGVDQSVRDRPRAVAVRQHLLVKVGVGKPSGFSALYFGVDGGDGVVGAVETEKIGPHRHPVVDVEIDPMLGGRTLSSIGHRFAERGADEVLEDSPHVEDTADREDRWRGVRTIARRGLPRRGRRALTYRALSRWAATRAWYTARGRDLGEGEVQSLEAASGGGGDAGNAQHAQCGGQQELVPAMSVVNSSYSTASGTAKP